MGDAQEDLFKAICIGDVEGVRRALEAGADAGPNLPWCARFAVKGAKMATIFGMMVGAGVTPEALAEARKEIYVQIQKFGKIKRHSVLTSLDSMLFVITEAENRHWNDYNYPHGRPEEEREREEEVEEQEVVEVEMTPASPEVVVVEVQSNNTAANSPDNSVMVSPGNSVVHKPNVAATRARTPTPTPPAVTVDPPAVPDKVSSSNATPSAASTTAASSKDKTPSTTTTTTANPTPESTASSIHNTNPHQGVLLQKLLFSKEFSDVHFECSDGTTLYANKQILAAACPNFFKRAFSNNSNQAVTVFNPQACHDVMKAVLAFIYTGDMSPAEALMGKHCAEFMRVASEYQLPALKSKAAASMEKYLTLDTLKDCLVTAHVNGLDDLKQACFNVVHSEGMAAIFGGPFVAGIVKDYPDLWMELAHYIQEEMAEETAGASSSHEEVQEQPVPEPKQPKVVGVIHNSRLEPKSNDNKRVIVNKNNKRVLTKLQTRKFLPELPEAIDLVTPKRRKFAFTLAA